MSYQEIWQEMTGQLGTAVVGYLRRRLHPELPFDLFLGLERPSGQRMLLLEVADASVPTTIEPQVTKGVELRLARRGPGMRTTLEVRLIEPSYHEIFSALVEDLVAGVARVGTERAAVSALIGRLQRWERFLQAAGPLGLSDEAQRGLYGELWFIAHHLLPSIDPHAVIGAWTGPEAAAHDFQFPQCALEVKTTTTKLPQHLSIASERQLDDTGLAALFLIHLSLDTRRDTDNSLPKLIDQLRVALEHQVAAAILFEDRLLAVGYLDAHRQRYEHHGYIVRATQVFRVGEGFPRITEGDLRGGVGNVRYSVAVAACAAFAVEMTEVEEAIQRGDGQVTGP